jgi:hypothetical protein
MVEETAVFCNSQFLFFYFYVREFPSHSCNDRRVFGLSRTSRERISRVGSVGDRVFFCAFLYEVRFRKPFSFCSVQFGHSHLLRFEPTRFYSQAESPDIG